MEARGSRHSSDAAPLGATSRSRSPGPVKTNSHSARWPATTAGFQFLGHVSDEQLVDLFAGAVAVPFVPVQEDYGLVMVEAFNSRKPVVTCLDSGEPLHFVTHGVNGLVVEPTPTLWLVRSSFIDRPERAAEMGDNGFRTVSHIRWESIASTLVHSVNGRDNVGAGDDAHVLARLVVARAR